MKRTKILSILLIAFGLLLILDQTNASTVTPNFVPGNPTCEDLGYVYGEKIDPPTTGTYTVGNGTITRTSTDGKYLDRFSTIGIDAVIVKGGNNANLYTYNPESKGDNNLVSPINNGGQIPNISHLEFCYDYEISVSKTATTSFDRQYFWSIEKFVDKTIFNLDLGTIDTANYTINVNKIFSTDSNRSVSGIVTIYNPDPNYSAIIENITDNINGTIPVDLNCGVIFPYTLIKGQTLTCTYNKTLSNSTNGTNTVEVNTNTSSKVGGGTADVNFSFGLPTNEIDEEIIIKDDKYTPTSPRICNTTGCTFNYSIIVGPYYEVIPDFSIINIATLTTNDTITQISDSKIIYIHINPPMNFGCTYTQGYRKNHSTNGNSKKANPTRNLLGTLGANTEFYTSLLTRYQILWTNPSKGNIYYTLAHQYIAAYLNKLSGASTTPEVDAAMVRADEFFSNPANTPNIANPLNKSKLNISNALKTQVTNHATILDNYNNGLIGPGHCDQ